MPQQNTVQFEKKNPLQHFQGLARQIALPHEFAPMRFPSFPALDRTAVMGFNTPVSLSFTQADAPRNRFMLTRQAAYPAWADVNLTSETYALYSSMGQVQGQFPTPFKFTAWSVGDYTSGTNRPTIVGAAATTLRAPILGVDSGCLNTPFFYVAQNWTISATLGANAAFEFGTIVTGNLLRWTAPGETEVVVNFEQVLNPPNASVEILHAALSQGWYQLSGVNISPDDVSLFGAEIAVIVSSGNLGFVAGVVGGSNPGGTVTVSGNEFRSFLPVVYPVEFFNSELPWTSTRTTAAAALLTNVTMVLNKGGTVQCGRLCPQTYNPFGFTTIVTTLPNLHPAEKAYLPLESGAYTFVPPSTDLVDFYDYTIGFSGTNAESVPCYRLDNTSLVHCMLITPPSNECVLAINIDWHIEFRTTSMLFQIGMSAATLESLHQAQLGLSSVGYFFSNSTHKEVLGKVLGQLMSFGKAVFPHLVNAAAISPGPLGVAGKLGQVILSSIPKSQMVPTSGQGSGITLSVKNSKLKKSSAPPHKVRGAKKK